MLQREVSTVGQPTPAEPAAEPTRLRLCIIVAAPSSIEVIYRGRLEYLREQGFDVTVVCSPSDRDDAIRARGVRLYTAPLTRAITPWKDLHALWRIWRLLRRERFDLVEVGFPKSALIGSLAAWLARVQCTIHMLHGLAYENTRGLLFHLLRLSTIVPCHLADVTISVSPSVRHRARADRVCRDDRIMVLGSGSFGGVDLEQFSPARRHLGCSVRTGLAIGPDQVVVGYGGRLTRPKGVVELVTAFRQASKSMPNLVLLLVGDYEARERPPAEVIQFVANSPMVRHVGWQTDPVPYYAAMDVLVLPSHREGMPTVLLEAAAMGLPTIASDATGCRDGMVAGQTGLQFPVGDVATLRDCILKLAGDPELRRRMGQAGRRWVAEHFDHRRVWKLYADEYRRRALQARR